MTDQNKINGAATPDDFRKYAEERGAPAKVVLPESGLTVLLRPPNALRVLLISERLAGMSNLGIASADERRDYIEVLARLIRDVMVQPKLSLTPGPNEIDPNWLPKKDADFLLKWSLGAVTSEGEDLSAFFRGPGANAEPRDAGGDVALPAVGASGHSGRSGF